MKTFQEIMINNLPKTIDEYLDKYGSESLRTNSSLVRELAENGLITKSILEKIADDIENYGSLKELHNNDKLLKCYVDLDCFDFLIEVYRNTKEYVSGEWNYSNAHFEYYYDMLLQKEWLFEYAQETNKLTIDLAKRLLTEIDSTEDLEALCGCSPVIECLLKNFLIDPEEEFYLETEEYADVDAEDGPVENAFERENINIFEYIKENLNLDDDEIDEYLKMYEFVNNRASERARSELIELIQNNEIAKNRLIQIIDSNLESRYDFDTTSLLQHLKQPEKKNISNI